MEWYFRMFCASQIDPNKYSRRVSGTGLSPLVVCLSLLALYIYIYSIPGILQTFNGYSEFFVFFRGNNNYRISSFLRPPTSYRPRHPLVHEGP